MGLKHVTGLRGLSPLDILALRAPNERARFVGMILSYTLAGGIVALAVLGHGASVTGPLVPLASVALWRYCPRELAVTLRRSQRVETVATGRSLHQSSGSVFYLDEIADVGR